MATATAPQMAIAEFLQSGGYERYLRKLRRILLSQVQQISAAVGRYFPPGTKVTRPQGGYVLWVELPRAVDALELHRRALAKKNQHCAGADLFRDAEVQELHSAELWIAVVGKTGAGDSHVGRSGEQGAITNKPSRIPGSRL
jgi:DNA-binding transcriptional MocR family regulator